MVNWNELTQKQQEAILKKHHKNSGTPKTEILKEILSRPAPQKKIRRQQRHNKNRTFPIKAAAWQNAEEPAANAPTGKSQTAHAHKDAIRNGILLKTDRACQDFEPNKNAKNKPKPHKASGFADKGYYEATYHKGKPAFLTFKNGAFNIHEYLTIEEESFLPKEYPNEFPYEPYGYYEPPVPNRKEIFWKIREEFNLFLDLEPIWKDYLAACVMLTYQQESANRTIRLLHRRQRKRQNRCTEPA